MTNQSQKSYAPQGLKQPDFLPMTRQEMSKLGWEELDILLVTGDAYIDHPTHGAALLGRWLIAHGFRTGLIAQPNWENPDDFTVMGRPRLFASSTAGALDSMLAHYTAFRKKRHDDSYTPGGQAGARPNRATLVYTAMLKRVFPGLPIAIGGIEASLRRFVHYDFWTDKLRRSALVDAKADMLMYGMGERSILALAHILNEGKSWKDSDVIPQLRGVSFFGEQKNLPSDAECLRLPSFEELGAEPMRLVAATIEAEQQVHQGTTWLIQDNNPREVITAPPAPYLTESELDFLYSLPFKREAHPSYVEKIPALEMIRTSITAHRGCGGGCSFCSLALHQGREIRSRSAASILNEARRLTEMKNWNGSISDVGGPSCNMWQAKCRLPRGKVCRRASCLFPTPCPNYDVPQQKYLELLYQIRSLPKVKHVRVASGLRYDLGLKDEKFLRAFVREFVGGQLKVAPEHLADHVLRLMRKPSLHVFTTFLELFKEECKNIGKKQYIIPYLISAFPGCSDRDMQDIARWLAAQNWEPQQVQCFIPTPGTVATAMYYAGVNEKGERIEVKRSDAERLRQHGYLISRPQEKRESHRQNTKYKKEKNRR